MAKLVWGAFARLNSDSQLKVADFAFEDPTSLKKVRGCIFMAACWDAALDWCSRRDAITHVQSARLHAHPPALSSAHTLPHLLPCSHTRARPCLATQLHTQVPCPSIFGEPSKVLSVVIPAFNEEDRLPATLQETLR